ncbi:MAG: hypothetical protein IJO22_05580 [Oscillospiraceae bacterium]|nr:hypothetical protein [Oscillospiraceae bacterium]
MEEIKKWAFSVCCAAISGGILNFIIPKENNSKLFKSVFYVFFLSVIISPVSDIDLPDFKNIGFSSEYAADSDELNAFSENSEKFIENKIYTDTEKILEESGCSAKDILVSVNISENKSIDITKFVITFDDIVNTNEIQKIVFEKIGIEPEIILSGEE